MRRTIDESGCHHRQFLGNWHRLCRSSEVSGDMKTLLIHQARKFGCSDVPFTVHSCADVAASRLPMASFAATSQIRHRVRPTMHHGESTSLLPPTVNIGLTPEIRPC